jgi:hypothetical protein
VFVVANAMSAAACVAAPDQDEPGGEGSRRLQAEHAGCI